MTVHSEQLLARLGERGVVLAADPHFPPLLEGLFDRAEGRLPHRPIRRDAVVDRVADALLASDDTPDCEALARLNASDLYLAIAIAAKDMRALEISEAELMPAVRQAIGRIDTRMAFVDQVSQRVRERLFIGDAGAPPSITQYRGAGPLARWVRVIASRVALEVKHAEGDVEPEAAPAEPPPCDPEVDTMWSTCADAYRAALAEALARLPQRDRNLLRRRYLDELNLDTLGRLYRVAPSTTSRWLQQIEDHLAAATRAKLLTQLSITEAQVHGMDRLVTRQLALALPPMLRSSAGDDGGNTER